MVEIKDKSCYDLICINCPFKDSYIFCNLAKDNELTPLESIFEMVEDEVKKMKEKIEDARKES